MIRKENSLLAVRAYFYLSLVWIHPGVSLLLSREDLIYWSWLRIKNYEKYTSTFLKARVFCICHVCARHSGQRLSLRSRKVCDPESRWIEISLLYCEALLALRSNQSGFHIFLTPLCYAQNSGMIGILFLFSKQESPKEQYNSSCDGDVCDIEDREILNTDKIGYRTKKHPFKSIE